MTTLAAGRGIGPAGDDAPQGTDYFVAEKVSISIVRWALRSLRLALNELAHMECDAVAIMYINSSQ